MTEFKKKKKLNGNQLRSESYKSDNQRTYDSEKKEEVGVVDEELLVLRKYYGAKTHLLVGSLRHFKLGGFEGTEIKTISDFIEWWNSTGMVRKHEKGEHIPLTIRSLRTEIEKIWAVIQKEDTEHIDPYGYDVRINQ